MNGKSLVPGFLPIVDFVVKHLFLSVVDQTFLNASACWVIKFSLNIPNF